MARARFVDVTKSYGDDGPDALRAVVIVGMRCLR
jgi:hypothetical protein